MGVIMHNVGAFPPGDTSWYGGLSPLDEWDIEALEKSGVVEAWYWYASSSYEGSGALIAKLSDGAWGALNLGHCSCYGPCDGSIARKPSLEALRESMSAELRDESSNLFAAIEQAAQ
jgi:hypothetical protein